MIARENDDVFWPVPANNINVLGNGISSAFVPVFVIQLLGSRQDIKAFVAFSAKKAPTPLQVADERVGFVLRRDTDAPDTGIHGIGKREVDDPAFATKIHRGFGANVCQFI